MFGELKNRLALAKTGSATSGTADGDKKAPDIKPQAEASNAAGRMRSLLGFGKNRVSVQTGSKFSNDKFAEMKKRMSRLKAWTEMKFEKDVPACRSQHACCQHEGMLFMYGGRDITTT